MLFKTKTAEWLCVCVFAARASFQSFREIPRTHDALVNWKSICNWCRWNERKSRLRKIFEKCWSITFDHFYRMGRQFLLLFWKSDNTGSESINKNGFLSSSIYSCRADFVCWINTWRLIFFSSFWQMRAMKKITMAVGRGWSVANYIIIIIGVLWPLHATVAATFYR